MKYLKIFEGHLDDYYRRITSRDFEVYQFGESNDFNKRVDFPIKIMNDIGSSLNKGFLFSRLYIGEHLLHAMKGISIYGMLIHGNSESIFIIQLEDEWFLVRQQVEDIDFASSGPYNESYIYYISDQVGGFLELLVDKNIIRR
jgi:hypothetical protein